MKTQALIKVKNKQYPYILEKKPSRHIRVVVPGANIDQLFLEEDIASLILDLPNLILAEQKYKDSQDEILRFRVSGKDKIKIEKKALAKGYNSVSKYLRDLALNN